MTSDRVVRAAAFFLPQFHPIPENDRWWGAGFTEWRNVVKAKPLFPGHEQPHLPADLGFYDLRVPEVRESQVELARNAGLSAFCYYHYWFTGKRLLEQPFDEVLRSGSPSFPFFLCWANEAWTRTWDGGDADVLQPQVHSAEDDLGHIRTLLPAFADSRYVRVDGRPVFLIYKASSLPDPRHTLDVWRTEASRTGLGELFLCRVDSWGERWMEDPSEQGFDAAVEFAPHGSFLPPPERRQLQWRVARKLRLSSPGYADHTIVDYSDVAERHESRGTQDWVRFPCVTPRWDNTPRKDRLGLILRDSSPDRYREWLDRAWNVAESQPVGDPLVFINAWNEWGEGSHLEPCERWGTRFLDATREVVDKKHSDAASR